MGAVQERELLRITNQFGNLQDLVPLPTIKTLIETQLSEDAAYMQSLLVHKVEKICGAHRRDNQSSYSLDYGEMLAMIGFMKSNDCQQWNQKNFADYVENLHSDGQ